jgi:hypothetical protein
MVKECSDTYLFSFPNAGRIAIDDTQCKGGARNGRNVKGGVRQREEKLAR